MRLLLVTQDFPPDTGGIQTYTAELAPHLSKRVEHFALVAPKRPGSEQVDAGLSFPVHRLPCRPDLLVTEAFVYLPYLARRDRFDVVFNVQWQTAPASLLARRLTGYPRHIVVAAHARELMFNPFAAGPAHRTYDRTRRRILRQADRITAVSNYTKRLLEDLGTPSEKIDVVTNGTNPDYFRPLDASAFKQRLGLSQNRVLLTVSRLVARKGVDVVLRALPQIAEAVPNVVYLVVGHGPHLGQLKATAEELGVAHLVRFEGQISYDDLPAYYNASDVFVLPSREEPPDVEGFGIVFLEAGACGKPAIGAASGGIPDALLHEQTGLLVPPDEPDALAAAAIRLLQDGELAARLGRQARRHTETFGRWEYVADRTFDVIRRAMTSDRIRNP